MASGRESLLREYAERKISNRFADHRINKSQFDRFTAEHRRRFNISKRAASRMKFSLADDEVALTHRGRVLGDVESDMEMEGREEDSEFGGELSAEHVHESHFGGHKSKAEVMREIISKSKHHKAERRAQRLEDEELQDELDEEFGSIRGLLSFSRANGPSSNPSTFEDTVAVLANDKKRVIASVRTPTIVEEAMRLHDAENARLARELGLPEDEVDHSESEGTDVGGDSECSDRDEDRITKDKTENREEIICPKADLGSVSDFMHSLLNGAMDADCTQDWLVEQILHLETQIRNLTTNALRELAASMQKILFDASLEPRRLFLLGIIIERVFSTTDARHSVATVFLLMLSEKLYSFEAPEDLLRGSLLLLRLAGPRRHLVPEAVHGLHKVLKCTATVTKKVECGDDMVQTAILDDWELFMGPSLGPARMAAIADVVLNGSDNMMRKRSPEQSSANPKLRAPLAMLTERCVKVPRLLDPVLVDPMKKRRISKDEGSYLRSAHRREHRGAVRELRRDNHVLSVVKHASMRQRREANATIAGRTYTLH